MYNGNFLGLLELLSVFDPIMKSPLEKVEASQQSGQRLAAHYLLKSSQIKLILKERNEAWPLLNHHIKRKQPFLLDMFTSKTTNTS